MLLLRLPVVKRHRQAVADRHHRVRVEPGLPEKINDLEYYRFGFYATRNDFSSSSTRFTMWPTSRKNENAY
jgi:hypothetical protein